MAKKTEKAAKSAESNGKKPVTEYVGISVRLFPNSTGKGDLIHRDIRLKEQGEKFEITMPFPANDSESMSLYNVDLETLARHGLRQLSYDTDTDCYNVIAENLAAGYKAVDFSDAVKTSLETAFFSERARKATGGAKAKAKEAKEAEAATGMTLAQMVAFVKASKGE